MREWKKYYDNPKGYAERIKFVVKKHDDEVRMLLFGSVVKGGMKPNSDIDVLVVTRLARDVKERMRIRVEIAKEIGDRTSLEIHIITPDEYEVWFRRFSINILRYNLNVLLAASLLWCLMDGGFLAEPLRG